MNVKTVNKILKSYGLNWVNYFDLDHAEKSYIMDDIVKEAIQRLKIFITKGI